MNDLTQLLFQGYFKNIQKDPNVAFDNGNKKRFRSPYTIPHLRKVSFLLYVMFAVIEHNMNYSFTTNSCKSYCVSTMRLPEGK